LSELKEQYQAIADKWDQVYQQCKASPELCEAGLSGIDLEDIHTMVGTIGEWIDKISPPSKSTASYRVASGLIRTTLAALNKPATALTEGNYDHFRSFLLQLNQIFSILYTLTISSHDLGEGSAAALTAALAGSVSDLERADALLATEIEKCKSAPAWRDHAEESATLAANYATACETSKDKAEITQVDIEAIHTTAENLIIEIDELKNTAAAKESEISALSSKAESLEQSIVAHEAAHTTLMQQLNEAKTRIDELLPEAASAGLAGAFARRVRQLDFPKTAWGLAFLAGIVILAFVSKDLTTQILTLKNNGGSVWGNIFQRLPILAPLVWFAWFSARRYSFAERIQEDYANKEASARAFEGYKKQMKEVGTDESVLESLCERAIEIYSKDPQRIYESKASDESPMTHMMGKTAKDTIQGE